MAEAEPAQISLPRESMVTVRLSDAEMQPATTADEMMHEVSASASIPSTRPSSRGSSRRSSTSSATNSVNWEGLEKTEEQEPRDQGTDDVWYTYERC
jgi:hypothetical protein